MTSGETYYILIRAPDKVRIYISTMPISSPNPMFDHLLESSHRDDSNKCSNIGWDEEKGIYRNTDMHHFCPLQKMHFRKLRKNLVKMGTDR